MTDPLLLLVAGVIVGIAVIVYWRVIVAILLVALTAVLVAGVVTVVEAVRSLTP